MVTQFNEIKDHIELKFSDSPLSKNINQELNELPTKEFDRLIDDKIENIRYCPIEGGSWEGDRGESIWTPEEDSIPQKSNPENKTWKEISDEHQFKGILFIDGEPQFEELIKANVEIEGFSEFRADNFAKADIELAKELNISPREVREWRKENGYTWHECRDMKTMQLVPSIVHNNIPHSGGIAEIKKGFD